LARERFEERGHVLVRFGQAPKRAILLRTDLPFKKIVGNLIAPDGSEQKIELLGDGQQVVAFGIHPTTKRPYSWHGGEPGQIKWEDLPYITEAEARAFVNDAVQLLVREHGYKAADARPKDRATGNGHDAGSNGGHADWAWLSANIHDGRELHDSICAYVAKLIASGMAGAVAVNVIRGLMESSIVPHDERWQDRYADIPRAVSTARDKYEACKSNGLVEATKPAMPVTFKPTQFVWRDPADIKRRGWLYGKHYLRKYVTCTIGRRGGGKTTRGTAEVLSMVTGRDLLDTGEMPEMLLRVWYIGEDTREEIEMRFIAACVHYGINPEQIADRLFCDSVFDIPRDARKVATLKNGAVAASESAISSLKGGIKDKKVDVLILDPLKKFHGVKENDNDMMDEVMSIFSEIAMELDMNIEVLHHTRKPSSGSAGAPMTVDDGRGADAIIAAARSARIINGMSPKDAPSLGIEESEVWRYTRIDNGKANMAPPVAAQWAQSASEYLPCGESVGVLETWKPPDAFDGMSVADINFIREVAKCGTYRADSQAATGWIGERLAERLGLNPTDKRDRARLSKIINKWIKTRVLDVVSIRDEDTRKYKKYVVPGKWQPVDPDCATS
jgi:hypothetical protein